MKSIIITGASRGIGYETALLLAQDYDYIAICCSKDTKKLGELKDKIQALGKSCLAMVGDVADYEFAQKMVNKVINDAGEITTLVNNAAISQVGLFTDTTPDSWQHIMNVNVNSVYNFCHAALPYMINKKVGQIINISSVWGLVGASCEVAYSTTKGAINAFTKALAKELAPSNISVNAIAFGAVNTTMNGHLDSEELDALCNEIPYGRMCTPIEAAQCIKGVLNMPEYLTGEIIKFDGGWI
ncbi:MAG: SDR family NAD(P)-dependent oxidoreductase [Lachnospiraceae bacterium]|nr:SDR family NAD(P)-dependent oxidoreductase [Lachnospiraceae bacterium]